MTKKPAAHTTAGEVVIKKTAPVEVFEKDTAVSFKTFDDMIKSFKARIREQDKNQLLLNWELGGQVKLLSDGAVYGKKTIQDMADKLDCSDSTLYGVKRLFETYPREMINKFIEKGLHYHTIAQLVGKKIDTADRESIEQKLLSGQVSNKDLPELLGKEPKKAEAKKVEVEVMDDDEDKNEKDDGSEDDEDTDTPPAAHTPAVVDPDEELEKELRGIDPKDPKAKVAALLRAVDAQAALMQKSLLTVNAAMDTMDLIDEPAEIEKMMGRVGSSMANLQKLNMEITRICALMKRMAL